MARTIETKNYEPDEMIERPDVQNGIAALHVVSTERQPIYNLEVLNSCVHLS